MSPDGERMEASVIPAKSMAPDGSAISALLVEVWEEEDRLRWVPVDIVKCIVHIM